MSELMKQIRFEALMKERECEAQLRVAKTRVLELEEGIERFLSECGSIGLSSPNDVDNVLGTTTVFDLYQLSVPSPLLHERNEA